MLRIVFIVFAASLLVLPPGCGKKESAKKKPVRTTSVPRQRTTKSTPRRQRERLNLSFSPPQQQVYVPPAGATGNTIVLPEVKQILSMVEQLSQDAPTTVIWLLDSTASNAPLLNNVTTQLGYFYQQPDRKDASDQLLTAIVRFAAEAEWLTQKPTSNNEELVEALAQLSQDPGSRELSFAVLGQVLERGIQYRVEDERQVVVVAVTDEAGDDSEEVEDVLATSSRYGIPVYVIGPSAPFGRTALLLDSVESSADNSTENGRSAILQGPESRYSERIQVPLSGFGSNMERVNSGFGPFQWERICRASGGSYLAVVMAGYSATMMRDSQAGGTYVQGRLDPEQMPRYAPDYVSEEGYQQLLSENAARRALHEAAKLPRLDLLTQPQTTFVVRSEVQLTQDLSKAQLAAARLEPAVQRLHAILKSGEQDRDSLTRPRWQAGYDLAMGRALAARARVEGYNAMLALLKRGKNFANAGSSSWVLVPDDTLAAGSNYQRMVDSARSYLEGVVQDHKGTPWARVAERELQTKLGWKWTEQ